jgi:acyl transferase domain-containing protein/NADPH:quinone reductase-like Zn-dependent oxidoreductase
MNVPQLTPLQRAFMALEETRAKLARLEGAHREPIAIVGVGCRAPGGGDDPEAVWRVFREGVDGIVKVPSDRWDADAFYDSDPEVPGKCVTQFGGFIRQIDQFDAALFGISPREAQHMDPQQRLFLEVAWEALELAGIAPDRLQTTRTGVYLGICTDDFLQMQLQSQDLTLIGSHFVSGIARSIASGRLSYLLGLQGPSISIDTACSSGLVAVHLACQSLRAGECRMAIAGGVNVMASPYLSVALSQGRMLAHDGRCKAFDAAADGYGRGEGCGVVVLKRLSDATTDGDRILALIRATAVNQDGPSSGLTAPNGPAQEAVIREALAFAGLSPHEIGYIDAHGTGTQLGDPLEMRALGNVFGPGRPAGTPLYVGSAKSNLGHLEAAAGIVGLLKVVLSLQHHEIAPHLHFKSPSPHIAWGDLPVVIPTEPIAWPEINGTRIGGISSFGVSGTNAHAVIEQAPTPARPSPQAERSHHIVTVSARSESGLTAAAARLAAALDGYGDADHADIAYTLNTGRALLPVRAAFTASTLSETREKLASVAQQQPAAGVSTGSVSLGARPRVAFLFTGQGSQYIGMARTLYDTSPQFRQGLNDCASELDPLLPAPLLSTLYPVDNANSPLDQTGFAQPALFAVEYALAMLWRQWGIEPTVVLGHSVGEVVAACVAGALSLPDALKLIAARGRLMQSLPSGGGMRAVFASLDRIEPWLAGAKDEVAIAALNGPEHVVLAGRLALLDQLGQALEADGIKSRPLQVSHAFHSALMDPILDAFENELLSVRFNIPQVRLISNLTGRLADPAHISKARYWRDHIRNPVRFSEGMAALRELKCDAIIEIGPTPTLTALGQQCLGSEAATWCTSLRRGRDDWLQLLDSLKALHMLGVRIDWTGFETGYPRRKLDLPTYPFQRERYWFRAKAEAALGSVRGRPTGDALLGKRLHSAAENTIYETHLRAFAPAFIAHHRVLGRVVLPATAYLNMLVAAARDVCRSDIVCIEDVTITEAMLLEDDGTGRMVQTVCGLARNGVVPVAISSQLERAADTDSWVQHITAKVRIGDASSPGGGPTLQQARDRCTETVALEEFYSGLNRRGGNFGEGFRIIRHLQRGDGQAVGYVVLTPDFAAEASAYRIHPALLDGCLQVMIAALRSDDEDVTPYLPIGIGCFATHRRPAASCWSHATMQPAIGDVRNADIRVFDNDGTLIAELRQVQLKRVGRDALNRLGERWLDECLFETQWKTAAATASALPAREWMPAILAKAAAAAIDGLHQSAGIETYDAFLVRRESLCVDYTLQAMHRLGWMPVKGEAVTDYQLAERLGVVSRHHRLFERLLAILAEAGWLTRDQQGWRVVRSFVDRQPEQEYARLIRECPAGAAPEIELVGRVASELAEALRGERDPLQLLFPGGSFATAEQIYRDSPTAKFFNGLMAEVVAAAQRAAGRRLRILEIGAGTGGTTAHVLPHLQGHDVEYTFTDVGPLFVSAARDRFGANAFMNFQTLDLERDPEGQGFAERQFDIIIAANVIHATADLRQTLGRVRRLLAPGGLLAMLEVTAPQHWFDLTVGLTPGWWAFADKDLRPDYATMPRESWLKLFIECGFEAVSALPDGTHHRGSVALQSLLLARASQQAITTPRDWLVFADHAGVAAGLAERLRTRGDCCTLVRGGSYAFDANMSTVGPTSAGDYRRLIADLRAAGRNIQGVVHAWSLNAGPWISMSATELDDAQNHGAMSIMLLAQALVSASPAPRLWLVTRGAQEADAFDDPLSPAQAPAWGIGKALALEYPELHCVCVDLPPSNSEAELDALATELTESGLESQVALRSGERRVARLARVHRTSARAVEAGSGEAWRLESPGALDQFSREPFKRRLPGPGEIEIAAQASGLNFKDVLSVLGMYPGDPGPLGAECAGRVTAVGQGVTHVRPGNAVLALASGSFASHVMTRAELVQPIPTGVSLEEGASFPVAFLTAEYCLSHLAGMRAGNRVLIHAAAGGVGMAAVKLAQRSGAEVFATAGLKWKRDLLREMGLTHVFDSRSINFADEILAHTDGRGVDLVLNSLSGELIDASFRALARGGAFVEIGRRGIKDPAWVAGLHRDLRYFIVDWSQFAEKSVTLLGGMLARLVDELREGTLTALPRHVFDSGEAGRAFRFMAQARHVGKIVLRHERRKTVAIRRDGTYLVTGGLSGLGLVVARWLAKRGAGRLVLAGRRGVTSEAAATLDELRAGGTIVVAKSVDVSDESAVRALLNLIREDGPPLRGVVHCAGVLDDAGLIQQDLDRFARVFGPKVRGGWLLDRLTRCDPLDCFVMFSSVAAVLGSAGQSNHSAANAFLDLLAHERRIRGLPGMSINWGAWTEVGAAVDRGVTDRLAAQGVGAVTPSQGLVALERLLEEDCTQTAVVPIDWHRYVEKSGHVCLPAFLADIVGTARETPTHMRSNTPTVNLREQLATAPAARRRPLVATFVRERALRALGVSPSKAVDPRTPLGEMGLDSLLSVELRNTLSSAIGQPLPATLLFDYPTIDALTNFLLKDKLDIADDAEEVATAQTDIAPASTLDSIENLCDEEVDRLLAARAPRSVVTHESNG